MIYQGRAKLPLITTKQSAQNQSQKSNHTATHEPEPKQPHKSQKKNNTHTQTKEQTIQGHKAKVKPAAFCGKVPSPPPPPPEICKVAARCAVTAEQQLRKLWGGGGRGGGAKFPKSQSAKSTPAHPTTVSLQGLNTARPPKVQLGEGQGGSGGPRQRKTQIMSLLAPADQEPL